MEVAEYIHRHGFRRWYERQLIESHAYLALAFIALILLLSAIEVLGGGTSGLFYLSMLAAAAAGGIPIMRNIAALGATLGHLDVALDGLVYLAGGWPNANHLFRYNPTLRAEGKNPLVLDSKEPRADIGDYMYNETRFRALKQINPERAAALLGLDLSLNARLLLEVLMLDWPIK